MRLHEMLSPRRARAFNAHLEEVRKRYGRILPAELVYPYASIGFVLRGHSEDDPRRPEFPAWAPRFPASRTFPVTIPGLEHLKIFIKDESSNPLSGTHKDRAAWEAILKQYYAIDSMVRNGKPARLPSYSIISSGNMAHALGMMAGVFGLPPVHVLVDETAPEQMIDSLRAHNVKVHATRLSQRLNSDQILRLTRNSRGIDLTNGHFAKEVQRNYFDWLSMEILNKNPDYVIVPYGTGNLYDCILHAATHSLTSTKQDPRLLLRSGRTHPIHLVGVTAESGSPADKLVAPHLPGSTLEEFRSVKANAIEQNIRTGFLADDHSGIHFVRDSDLAKALKLARTFGIQAGYSGVAGLAWLLRNGKTIKPGSRVVVVNTGKGITED